MTEKGRAALAAMKTAAAGGETANRTQELPHETEWREFKEWAGSIARGVLYLVLGLLLLAAILGLLVLAFSTAPWWAVVIILLLLVLIFR
jgi:hypothetical protein